MTRQGVQRVADLLVAHHLAEYRTNPAHRRFAGSASWPTRSATGLEHNWPRTNCGTRHLVALLEADKLPPND
jgi:hypothetical protein